MGLPARSCGGASGSSTLRVVTPGKPRAASRKPGKRASGGSATRSPAAKSGKPQAKGRRPTGARAAERRARAVFRGVLLAMMSLAVFGLGRVAIAAKAAEASIDAGRLKSVIKQERLVSDELEVDKSALSSPSRIGSIAESTMSMSEAKSVRYLAIPPQADERPDDATVSSRGPSDTTASGGGRGGSLADAIAAAMRMAAGEAQLLLVGDVGLASSR